MLGAIRREVNCEFIQFQCHLSNPDSQWTMFSANCRLSMPVQQPNSVGSPRVSKGWFPKRPSFTVGLLTRATLACQLFQTLRGQHQRLVFLAETKANLLRAQRGIAVEARARNTGDADFANQMAREFHIIFETKGADVGHDVISAVRRESSKTRALELRQNQITASLIIRLKPIVVRSRERKRVCAGCL